MPRQFQRTPLLAGLLMVLLSSGARGQSANENGGDLLKLLGIPLWSETAIARGELGYKDNVTLSSTNQQKSIFWNSGGDFVVYRLPTDGWSFNCFGSGKDTRFFDGKTEDTALAAAKITRWCEDGYSSGLGAKYIYLNAVMNLDLVSTNGQILPPSQAVGDTYSGDWFLRKDFQKYWIEFDMNGTRQLLNVSQADPGDASYWQAGPQLVLGSHLCDKTDLSLTAEWREQIYDDFPDLVSADKLPTNFVAAPGSHERLQTEPVTLDWRQILDSPGHLRGDVAGAFTAAQDNGSGYYNYHEYGISAKLEYQSGGWKAGGQLRVNYFDFPVQTVVFPGKNFNGFEGRYRYDGFLVLHAEKKLSKRWTLNADYSYEYSTGDSGPDRYHASIVSMGAEWHY